MAHIFSKIWLRGTLSLRLIYGLMLRFFLSSCGKRFLPAYPLVILGGGNIAIGNNFQSMAHCYLYGNEGEIIIGNNISLNTNVQIGSSGGKIYIGDNVLIGPNVVIRAANHGISRKTLINKQSHTAGIITIEDDVWIGANAVILPNVRVGKGSVVAAGAVVTKNIDPYTVVGGVPARKISQRT